ncbi:Dicer-like protein 1 [Tilletia horrida]|nr:Dicer-like protein 1 [Tilletia horrida]
MPTPAQLEPRPYQLQLFELAKRQNVIACADTGTGKTLVAVLLLKWMLDEEGERCASERGGAKKERRISIFLVQHVPLVQQQGDYISANSALEVEKLFGELNIDLWTKEEWARLRNRVDCIVCTAQILMDALNHGFLSIGQINLLVFDEAHHASKDAVYARIMRSHYHKYAGDRPKIFGMTASPIASKDSKFIKSAEELEAVMDARLFTIPVEGRASLAAATFKAKAIQVEYDTKQDACFSDFCVRVMERLRKGGGGPKGFLNRMDRLGPHLGPALCDILLEVTVADGRTEASDLEKLQGLSAAERAEMQKTWNEATEKAPSLDRKMKMLRKICEETAQLTQVLDEEKKADEARDGRVSPKIKKLMRLLEDFKTKRDGRGIIFVKEKLTVVALTRYLSAQLAPQITVEAIVGHSGRQGHNWKHQKEVLAKFRAGNIQLLIATSVVEEGLDVPACNFVIRFDLPETPIQMIQSRGRARQEGSAMYLMCDIGSERDVKLVNDCERIETGMKEWLSALPADRLATMAADDLDEGEDGEAEYVRQLQSKETEARIDAQDAPALLNRYVQSLPNDQYTLTSAVYTLEEDESTSRPRFRCSLVLPARSKLRQLASSWQPSKKTARQAAAFEACKQLYAARELDEHLLPRRPSRRATEVIEVHDENGEVRTVERQKLPLPVAQNLAGLSTPSTYDTCWATRLPFDNIDVAVLGGPLRPLILLTPTKPPSVDYDIELYALKDNIIVPWQPSKMTEIALSEEQMQLAKTYSERVLQLVARSDAAPSASTSSWMVLPADPAADTDALAVQWEEVTALAADPDCPQFRPTDEAGIETLSEDVALAESPDVSKRPYALRKIRKDLSPSGPAPKDTRQAKVGETFQQYYRRVAGKDVRGDGPMLEAQRLPRMQNYTTRSSLRSVTAKIEYLMPAVTYIYPIPASTYRAVMILPSFLGRLNAFLLAQECQATVLKEVAIRIDDLIVALTAPSADLPFSYQKQEFVGDSTLKLLATCHAFVSLPDADEGQLTDLCMRLVSNRALARHSLRLQLWRFVCLNAFTAKTWTPPGYRLPERETGQLEQPAVSWSAKRLADIVEALLGSVASDSIDDKLRVAHHLEILPTEISGFSGFGIQLQKNLAEVPIENRNMPVTETIQRLMRTIGYTFKHPYLALNAVTHSSCMGSVLPSYERLEVLGDALLDFLVVEMLHKKHVSLEEGGLTIMKANSVNNKTLAALAVSLGLQKFLVHSSSMLAGTVASYVEAVEAAQSTEDEKNKGSPQQYWWSIAAPKTCADVSRFLAFDGTSPDKDPLQMIESILGAVLVDSGFNLDTARTFFERNYRPFLERFCTPENALLSSAEDLFEILLRRHCTDWHFAGIEDDTMEEGMLQDGDTLEEGMPSDGTLIELRLPAREPVRIVVHGEAFGETKRGGNDLKHRARTAGKLQRVIMTGAGPKYLTVVFTQFSAQALQCFRKRELEESEVFDALREVWPRGEPLFTKRMCMPRLLLEALCHCEHAQDVDEP